MKHVAIVGAGGMGTALALLFARSTGDVRLWSRDPSHAREMAATRSNARPLPGNVLPPSIAISSDARMVLDRADLVVAAVPTSYLRATIGQFAGSMPGPVPVLSVVKGIEFGTFARPSRIIEEALGPRSVAVLSGPSHAEEIARGLPASVVVSGLHRELNDRIRDALNQSTFRVYTSDDALGVELAGALKNILGIAAGICDGLGFGDNAKAALLTRGLVEIARLGMALGARRETFYGLAGVGDVVTTCYSPYGRNRAVGERIGRGESLDEVLGGMVNVAEGVPTTRSVHELARELGVEMPITAEVHQILFEGKSPRLAVTDLMDRMPRVEWE
ncbi:MAG: NAD(P)H-dependent glycerol-3-phosphate dehydrogenase [Isosphaeraceae bacterium]